MSRFDSYAICPGCDSKYHAPFGRVFHIHFDVCPQCGEKKREESYLSHSRGWKVVTLRWVSTAKLLRPSTWGTGFWETPDEARARTQ